MTYSTQLCVLLTTLSAGKPPAGPEDAPAAGPSLEETLQPALKQILDLAEQFRAAPLSGQATLDFEQQLHSQLREMGRQVLQHTFNACEPDDVQVLPKHIHFQTSYYTRLNRKTPQNVWTLFGQIRLRRVGYRSTTKNGEPTVFPLAHCLGLIAGASPALARHVARLNASPGMTQRLVLQRLRQDQGIGWGVKKLRELTQALSDVLAPRRHACQVERLLQLLGQASAATGKHKPVLSVGRDGVTLSLRVKKGKVFEVATAGTVSVIDRSGKRLGTVYLAYTPEADQVRMSRELTRLLREVLQRWEGPLPRLCYVSDAGSCETSYYNNVLAKMVHPRTGKALKWIRVLDYYHASQRLWTMAECLFGKGRAASSWVRKMQKWLLQGGVRRVLHSAGAYQGRAPLTGKKKEDYERAYNYLRRRMKYMRYDEYKRQGLPCGSGVTEAACKTIYTQRLKLSGMRWDKPGAQVILDLRVLLLSDVLDRAFECVFASLPVVKVPPCEAVGPISPADAA